MNGIVFPDPVPPMTIASNPRIIASETSICQAYGSQFAEALSEQSRQFISSLVAVVLCLLFSGLAQILEVTI